MNLQTIGYVILCLTLPALWGVFVYLASNRLEKLFKRSTNTATKQQESVLPDYEI